MASLWVDFARSGDVEIPLGVEVAWVFGVAEAVAEEEVLPLDWEEKIGGVVVG